MNDAWARFRVATWNILQGVNPDLEPRLLEAAEHMKTIDSDIFLIQEASYKEGAYDALQFLADNSGYQVASMGVTAEYGETNPLGLGHASAVGVLTKLPVVKSEPLLLSPSPQGAPEVNIATLLSPKGNPVVVCSLHLAWGAANESCRFRQAQETDLAVRRECERLEQLGQTPIGIIGGDFNTTPDSRTLRWLRGLEPGPGEHDTFWVDSWISGGDGSEGYTSNPDNPLGHRTARSVGISRPARNPYRRIDYLLVRGWVYGGLGDPIRAGLFGDETITGTLASDHLGLWADIADAH